MPCTLDSLGGGAGCAPSGLDTAVDTHWGRAGGHVRPTARPRALLTLLIECALQSRARKLQCFPGGLLLPLLTA